MHAFNYLFSRKPRDSYSMKNGCDEYLKDEYLKVGAAGVGMAMGIGTLYYAITNMSSTITREKAQHCAKQTLEKLVEVQRQLQLFNASCIPESPGSAMSTCNATLLPKLVNTSCADIPVAMNYLPIIFVVAAVTIFGLFMGKSILVSFDQRNKQLGSEYSILTEEALLNCSADDEVTLSETYHRRYGTAKTNLLMPPYHRNLQYDEASFSSTPEEYSSTSFKFKDDESNSDKSFDSNTLPRTYPKPDV